MQGYHVPHTIKISNLKKIRNQKHITQKELANRSGVPFKTIGNFEQQLRDINCASVNIVYRLAAALGCRMEDLIGKERL